MMMTWEPPSRPRAGVWERLGTFASARFRVEVTRLTSAGGTYYLFKCFERIGDREWHTCASREVRQAQDEPELSRAAIVAEAERITRSEERRKEAA